MTEDTFVRETSEGSQELHARGDTPPEELQREVGSVLRLPEGVGRERFELVAELLSLSARRRVRVRVQVPEGDPAVDSVFDLYAGAEAMER